jgi:hypothetical protein
MTLEYPTTLLDDLKKNKPWEINKIIETGMTFSMLTNNLKSIELINEILLDESKFVNIIDANEINLELKGIAKEYQHNKPIPRGMYIQLFKICGMLVGKYKHNVLELNFDALPDETVYYGLWSTTNHHVAQISEFWINLRAKIQTELESPKKKTHLIRSPWPRGIRYEALKRALFRCEYCGVTKEDTQLHLDHIIPVSKGGTDELDNIRVLCAECNLNKSDSIHGGRE